MAKKKKTTKRESSKGRKSRSPEKEKSAAADRENAPRVGSDQREDINLTTEELLEELDKIKALTSYAVASRFEINLSKAKVLLRNLEEQGLIRCVGGNSRMRLYARTSS